MTGLVAIFCLSINCYKTFCPKGLLNVYVKIVRCIVQEMKIYFNAKVYYSGITRR